MRERAAFIANWWRFHKVSRKMKKKYAWKAHRLSGFLGATYVCMSHHHTVTSSLSLSSLEPELKTVLGFAVGRGGDHNVTLLQNDISEREDAEERVDSDSNSAQGLF